MTQSQRLALALMLVLLLLVLLSGAWLWQRLASSLPRPAATPAAPPPAPAATPSSVATVVRAAPGYRLAGVAVADPDSFAVIETPSGANVLYRLNEEVPGLGRLVRIEAERIVLQSDAGPVELWIAPAATATPTRARTPSPRRAAARTPTPTPAPRRWPADGGTTRESTPSAARD